MMINLEKLAGKLQPAMSISEQVYYFHAIVSAEFNVHVLIKKDKSTHLGTKVKPLSVPSE